MMNTLWSTGWMFLCVAALPPVRKEDGGMPLMEALARRQALGKAKP